MYFQIQKYHAFSNISFLYVNSYKAHNIIYAEVMLQYKCIHATFVLHKAVGVKTSKCHLNATIWSGRVNKPMAVNTLCAVQSFNEDLHVLF